MFDIHRFEKRNEMHRSREDNGRNIWPFPSVREEIERTWQSIESNIVNQIQINRKRNDHQSFSQAIRPILAAAEILGIPSMRGPSIESAKTLPLRIISYRRWYTVSILILLIIRIIVDTYRANEKSIISSDSPSKGTIIGLLKITTFYSNCSISLIIFLRISTKWADLMKEWKTMEKQLNSGKKDQLQYRKKLYKISCFMMILAVVEHILGFIVFNLDSQIADDGFMGEYYDAHHMRTIPTTLNAFFGGMVMFIVREIANFTWNFTDLFIMLVSTGLAEQYKFLNKATLNSIKKNRFSIDWLELRKKYTNMSIVVKKTDECISTLVFFSVVINIYVICLQLFSGITMISAGPLHIIYFFGSFAFLVGRATTVTLLAAKINDESKLLLPQIYCCPASSFTSETERLCFQLTFDNVALTGMKLFSINRKFLMSICSIIMTYEIVMLQISKIHIDENIHWIFIRKSR